MTCLDLKGVFSMCDMYEVVYRNKVTARIFSLLGPDGAPLINA